MCINGRYRPRFLANVLFELNARGPVQGLPATGRSIMQRVLTGEQVEVAQVAGADRDDLIAANLASIALHGSWVSPCRTPASFDAYLESCDGERKIGYIARRRTGRAIVGVINVSEIIRGSFQSAFLGYYAVVGSTGRGLMTEALSLVIEYCFQHLRLHRLEANIQPGNGPSLALVRRLGFRKEGFSPRYLHIDGEWRDHERWAILADEWSRPSPMPRGVSRAPSKPE